MTRTIDVIARARLRSFLGLSVAASLAGSIACADRREASNGAGAPRVVGGVVGRLVELAADGASYRVEGTSAEPLSARLPRRADAPMRLSVTSLADTWVDVKLACATPSIAEREGDRLVHRDVQPGVDLVRTARRSPNGALGVEESLVVHRPAAQLSTRFEIVVGPSIARARLVGGRVELVDRTGHPRLASAPVVANDAAGRSLAVETRLDRIDASTYALAIDVDANSALFPVVIDPTWALVKGTMATPRAAHESVEIPDAGSVYVIGGATNGFNDVLNYELLDLATGLFTTPSDQVLDAPASYGHAFSMPSGRVLVEGAATSGDTVGSQLLDLSVYFETSVQMHDPRGGDVAVLIPGADRRVLAVGGTSSTAADTAESALSSAEIFAEGTTPTWTSAPPMAAARYYASGALMADGHRVLVVGGKTDFSGIVSTGEIFDTSTATAPWVPAGTLQIPRYLMTVATASDGMTYAIGGDDTDSQATDVIERYDESLPGWVLVGHLKEARTEAIVVPVASGGLLVAAGAATDGTALSTAEIVTPGNPATTTSAPSLNVPRWHASALQLADGRILVSGGLLTNEGDPYSSAEIYDPGSVVDAGADAGADAVAETDAETVGDANLDTTSGVDASDGHDANEASVSASDSAIDGALDGPLDATPPTSIQGSAQHCTASTDCSSGFCIDGVCCDQACDQRCYSCVLPTSPGVCTVEPAGVDLGNACASSSCFGTCDGSGHCAGTVQGSQCAPSQCTTASAGVGPAYCAASREACPTSAQVAFDCAPYACDKAFGSCVSICKTADDCAPSNVCDPTSHACVIPSSSKKSGCTVAALGDRSSDVRAIVVGLLAIALGRRRRSKTATRYSSSPALRH